MSLMKIIELLIVHNEKKNILNRFSIKFFVEDLCLYSKLIKQIGTKEKKHKK